MRMHIKLADGDELPVSQVLFKSGGGVHISTTYRGVICSADANTLDEAIKLVHENVEKTKLEMRSK